jgi:hypothetical protein
VLLIHHLPAVAKNLLVSKTKDSINLCSLLLSFSISLFLSCSLSLFLSFCHHLPAVAKKLSVSKTNDSVSSSTWSVL